MAGIKTITDTRWGVRSYHIRWGERAKYEVEEIKGDATSVSEFNVLKNGELHRGGFMSRREAVESAEEDSGDFRY